MSKVTYFIFVEENKRMSLKEYLILNEKKNNQKLYQKDNRKKMKVGAQTRYHDAAWRKIA